MFTSNQLAGPNIKWNGRRHGRRKDRRWASAWSPEQIANRIRIHCPNDEAMRISPEAIYQSLYIQGRGNLKHELVACLRTGRALRVPRARARRGKSFVCPEIMISERPAEAQDRAIPGLWEGDLILGLGSSAIGTLVERTTRFTILLHLPRMDGYGGIRIKNGPALAGHGAEAVRKAVVASIKKLPPHLRRSLACDQGAECRSISNFVSTRICQSTSVIHKAPGNEVQMKILTGCFDNTFQRAQTYPDTLVMISMLSPQL